ncbi:MAG: hypothetical protein ACXWL2_00855 [Candidatus Chromulinivorax sp.]
MSKNSKSCGYTGRMHIMNRKNKTKQAFEAKQESCCAVHKNFLFATHEATCGCCKCKKINKQ